jgi:hypothetical protein
LDATSPFRLTLRAEKWIKDHPDSVDSDFRTENTDEQEEDKKDKKKRKRDDSPSKEDKKSSDKKAKNKDSRDEEEHDKRRKSKESMDAADRAQDEDIKWIEPSSTKSKKSVLFTSLLSSIYSITFYLLLNLHVHTL